MEAAEFALRIARVTTGRKGILSFEGCMHGKSAATAFLGWPNDLVTFPDFIRLPYVSRAPQEQILSLAEQKLRGREISAVVVEPLQGSSGGHMASSDFFRNLSWMCRKYGSLLIVDEIFTGFHRTGEAFLHQELDFAPDVVLIGKAMGNGFPVSGVVIDSKYSITGAMLPGSTYAGNALACAAVAATLALMKTMDLSACVAEIHRTIETEMAPVMRAGVSIHGRGALWILQLPPTVIDEAVTRIFQEGVVVSVAGPYLRLLPAATISTDNLVHGCAVVREAILASLAS
jgi:acetylornithine aminotransferase